MLGGFDRHGQDWSNWNKFNGRFVADAKEFLLDNLINMFGGGSGNIDGDIDFEGNYGWSFSFGAIEYTSRGDKVNLENNDYRSRMSEEEKKIFDQLTIRHKIDYLGNAQYASKMAKNRYPNSLHNGNGDAFRHALFSALNAKDLGIKLAKELGDAHETLPNNPKLETEMDLFNNQIGRDMYLFLEKNDKVDSFFREVALMYLINKLIPNGSLRKLNTLSSQLIPTD